MYRTLILFLFLAASCTTSSLEQKDNLADQISQKPPHDSAYLSKSYEVGKRPRDIICADLNRDGYNDIATSLKQASLAILFNDRKGDFSRTSYETLTHNTSLAAADIDGDGDIDLVPLTEAMFGPIFLNDGRGKFTRHDTTLKSVPFSWHIEPIDINNDKLPDFVATSRTVPQMMLVINKGDLQFETSSIDLTYEEVPLNQYEAAALRRWNKAKKKGLPDGVRDFAVVDMNGDGLPDMILPHYLDRIISIALNDGKGTFDITHLKMSKKDNELDFFLSSIAVLKYDDRSLPDIAVSSEYDGRVFIFEIRDNTLQLKDTVYTDTRSLIRITSDDMNGDGLPDIIGTFAAPLPDDPKSPVQVWLNTGEGFSLSDNLKSEGFGAYIGTCKILPDASPSIGVSNIHEETMTIFSKKK